MIQLNLLTHQDLLSIHTVDGKAHVKDPIRQKDVILGPEELVRQLLIQYLLSEKGYNKTRIAVEKGLQVGELQKRVDVLLYDQEMAPWMLVECKAPNVAISQATMEQIARYNMPLKVKYLLVTNGVVSLCCRMDYQKKSFEYLDELPAYP